MNVLDSLNDTSKIAISAGEVYVKKSKEYAKLKVFQQLTITVSLVGKMLIIGAILFISVFFLAAAAAIAIGYLFDNMALGCLIIGGLFMILALIVYLFRSYINKKVISSMSLKFFD